MAEALGTAAAIIQLAGVGLTLAKVLYKVSDEITSSAKQVKELASYVHSTSIVLEEVGKVFEEEGTAPQPIISPNAITTANEVIARCQTIFEKLHQVAEDARTNTFGAIILVLTSSRRLRLQTGLERSKSDLQLMMQIIIYARLKLQVW
ncbi:uncharacterized protein N7511_007162 [Penicillium nucicola]|uniref:uncharacterized protein n=1 Tax=Penicillium nucicola TaxID=1850975 RepID=UPI0025450AE1|nr:uncharacterized protein N7511_007162 [Penicillium nucicola]KAJ5756980.1 hypothetical protein N7511_007162 [Penicillium nucicola]